jgi:segregation and condensation protein A
VRDATYTIKLDNFAGPLDLLLRLIERQKLDICDISLAVVTQDYIQSIQDLVVDPHQANWFLDIASRLIVYKSRALLPDQDDITTEPLIDLTEQLQMLAAIREASMEIAKYAKTPFAANTKPRAGTSKVHYSNLALDTFASAYPKKLPMQNQSGVQFKLKRQNPIHLRTKLATMWQSKGKLEIANLDTYCANTYETVVCFLLALEMIKDNKAVVTTINNSAVVELV